MSFDCTKGRNYSLFGGVENGKLDHIIYGPGRKDYSGGFHDNFVTRVSWKSKSLMMHKEGIGHRCIEEFKCSQEEVN